MFFEIKAKKTIVNAFYSVRFWQGSRAHWTVKSKKIYAFISPLKLAKSTYFEFQFRKAKRNRPLEEGILVNGKNLYNLC